MSEDVIWQILDEQFCSFKARFEKKAFCKNEYNLTGICNKQYCPLANGRYATVREEDGVLFLHIKTIERAHSPANLWEKIQLPEDIGGALSIINQHLAFWPKRFVNKVKERLVRLHQYLIRYRKWYYRAKPRLVTVHKKFERREQRRELKSLIAAKLDTHILQELQDRFDQGVYDKFINLNNKAYQELLREAKRREIKANKGRKKGEDTTEQDDKETAEDEVEFSEAPIFEAEDEEEAVQDIEDIEGLSESELEHEKHFNYEDEEAEKEIEAELEQEADEDIRRYTRQLLETRKRKAAEKQKKERKKEKDAKRIRYPQVEIEYEEDTPARVQNNN